MANSITACVPMRHSSERVKGKNYRMFGDAPLFHHILRSLLRCPEIDEVVVDTDSPVVTEQINETFPMVRVLERPEHLRDGSTPMNDVLAHDAQFINTTHMLQTHSTNPLLTSATMSEAIKAFFESGDAHDSLFGVTKVQTRFWDQNVQPVNHNPAKLERTQDLPPLFEENSNIYIFSRDLILNGGNRIGSRPMMFEIPKLEAQDIDEEPDFLLAEALWKLAQG